MTRCWIGLGLLLLLLAAGFLVTWSMARIHEPVTEALDLAAAASLAGNWDGAQRSFSEAMTIWESHSQIRSWFASHSPIEEIESKLSQTEIYLAAREDVAFSAACAELARMTQALGDAHSLTLQNLL